MTYLKEYLKVRTSLYVNANTKKQVNPKKYQEEKRFFNRETNSFNSPLAESPSTLS